MASCATTWLRATATTAQQFPKLRQEFKMTKLTVGKYIVWNDQLFAEGMEYIKCLFETKNILDDQKITLAKFFKGKDSYFSAPTGYGKSLVFQAISIIADHLGTTCIPTFVTQNGQWPFLFYNPPQNSHSEVGKFSNILKA